ncbi:hypothetical protein ACFYNO_06510 [Kitasatospora sp. NPDC006697]|uniref:hypothetical protein n=1 Tax=Kitasatospora sp. NPDC006697 TaxID=3364020 RepID=UPI0036B9A02C
MLGAALVGAAEAVAEGAAEGAAEGTAVTGLLGRAAAEPAVGALWVPQPTTPTATIAASGTETARRGAQPLMRRASPETVTNFAKRSITDARMTQPPKGVDVFVV